VDLPVPRQPAIGSAFEILEELGSWADAGDQQVVAGASAGDIEQVPLGIVDVFEIGLVGDVLDALL
jgi:hypothetical protein